MAPPEVRQKYALLREFSMAPTAQNLAILQDLPWYIASSEPGNHIFLLAALLVEIEVFCQKEASLTYFILGHARQVE